MEQHSTLGLLLSSLSQNNILKNWSIFEDTSSGSIIVKLRFLPNDEHLSETIPVSFRRKSHAQVKRDQERCSRHRGRAVPPESAPPASGVCTRSQRRDADTSVEGPRLSCSSESVCDNIFSDTTQYHMTQVKLNPVADEFVPTRANSGLLIHKPARSSVVSADGCMDLGDTDPPSPGPLSTVSMDSAGVDFESSLETRVHAASLERDEAFISIPNISLLEDNYVPSQDNHLDSGQATKMDNDFKQITNWMDLAG